MALDRVGRTAEARQAWAEFEDGARAEMHNWDSANIELTYYYANHADRPTDALALARREAGRRQDVGTLEALAWALHVNGQSSAARREIDKVLAVGVTQPGTFARAAAIAAELGDTAKAQEYGGKSLRMCGASAFAGVAQRALAAAAETK